MKTKTLVLVLLVLTPLIAWAEPEKEMYDFNFDGHMDYRVMTLPNAKGSQFDVFLYDPKSETFVKDKTLSGTVYPRPDPKTKRVLCIWNGGHSGALFTGAAYVWNGKEFGLAFTVRQEAVAIEGKIHYIRVKARIEGGKPVISSIETAGPFWDDKGMSIE